MCEWTGWSVPSRRDGGVCGLSDVLEPMSPSLRKYFLSPTALRGILRRADARGKALPTLLRDAIEWMLGWWETQPQEEQGGGIDAIALDGDKLKPRLDQRKGGNGFGINEDGTGGNNLPLVCFSKVSHPTAKDGDGERWDEREVAQTRNTFDNGEKRCQEVIVSTQGLDGYNQQLTGDVSPTCRAKNADTDHLPLIVSTNSNGEDVAATINANMSKLGGDNQTTFGGGYCITRREEGAHDEPQL